MNRSFLALAFQEAAPEDSSMWIIVAVVVVILFLIVLVVAVGLTIFLIMRKRKKALTAPAQPDMSMSTGPSASAYVDISQPEMAPPLAAPVEPAPEPAPPIMEAPAPLVQDSYEEAAPPIEEPEFDPSRTVAIVREKTVPISYGSIKFVSGVLTGQQFEVEPEGSYIGRESTLSQIVVSDPRISKRHLWIGLKDGAVKVVDHDSRNGTFINDPKSERITEATLNSGDTVIMGESDVARFEFQASTFTG